MIKLSEREIQELSKQTFDSEDKLQSSSFSLISKLAPELIDLVFHPKNEQNFGLKDRADDVRLKRKNGESDKEYFARLGAFYGGKEKAKGVVPGIPDLCFKFHGIFFSIELKIEKVGSGLSKDQIRVHKKLNEDYEFIQVFVCRNLVEVYRALIWILECDFRIYKESYVKSLKSEIEILEDCIERWKSETEGWKQEALMRRSRDDRDY